MTEKGFEPLSSQLGIPGTSYRLQLGLINEKWASRILKGNNIIDSYVYKDEDVEGGYPNQNLIVGWVLRTVAIPNINPHQVMKTTQALMKQARENKDKQKVVAPLSETKDVELEKVPEGEIKRPKASGWVKEEAPHDTSEEQKRKAFQESVKAKKEGETIQSQKGRQLHSIPSADQEEKAGKVFCPFCGGTLPVFVYCPYCGKKLPHD
ncbi:MAG: hypothetical protein ACQERB_00815 [Promethearchaeati archaeon]